MQQNQNTNTGQMPILELKEKLLSNINDNLPSLNANVLSYTVNLPIRKKEEDKMLKMHIYLVKFTSNCH